MRINELVDKYINSHQIRVAFYNFDPCNPPNMSLWENELRKLTYVLPKAIIKEYLKIKNSGNLFTNLYSLLTISAEQFWKDIQFTERLKAYKGKKEHEHNRANLIEVEEFLQQKPDVKYIFSKDPSPYFSKTILLIIYRPTKSKLKI